MVLSMIATAFIGFGVWVHHMFATGLPQLGQSFFTAASIMIVDPDRRCRSSAGSPRSGRRAGCVTVPLLYVARFFFVFIIGGLTGVMLASVPLDRQVHDTYFVVAHFHYVLIGGSMFPLLGAIFYWFPKMTGRMHERTARAHGASGCCSSASTSTFFPMHQLGLAGHAAARLHLSGGDGLGRR